MASPERVYHGAVRLFSLLFVAVGVAILATTLANGGGPGSLGFVLGIAFLAAGLVRGWLGRQDRGHAPS